MKTHIMALMIVLSVSVCSFGQTITPASSGSELITLELKNIDIVEVLKILSRKISMNIIISPNVKGRITLFLNNVDVRQAFDSLLEAAELAVIQNKNIMQVIPDKEYEARFGESYHSSKQLKTIAVRNLPAVEIAQALSKIKPRAGVLVDERSNSLLLQDTEENLTEMQSVIADMDQSIVTRNYELKHLGNKQTEDIIKLWLGAKGTYYINSGTRVLTVKDYSDNLSRIMTLVEAHDVPPVVLSRTYELDYAKFDAIEAKIKPLLTTDLGTIVTDERTNKIIISDLEQKFEEIERIISAYDTKDKQVLIEAKIVQVLLNDQFQFGINWQSVIENINSSNLGLRLISAFDLARGLDLVADSAFAAGINSIGLAPGISTPTVDTSTTTITSDISTSQVDTSPSTTTRTSGNNFSRTITDTNELTASELSPFNQIITFPGDGGARLVATGTIDGRQFEGVLNALKGMGKTNVLSSPRIITLNNKEAKIQVVNREAYVTSTTVTPGSGPSTTSENVTFIDVGITLAVTPVINKKDFITISVKPSVSSVNSTVTTSSGNRIPIVSTQELESNIQVKNGTTILLGGLHEKFDNKQETRVPFLGKIPLLGLLFKKINNRNRNSELVMFLTPHIIEGDKNFYELDEDLKKLSPDMQDYLSKEELVQSSSSGE